MCFSKHQNKKGSKDSITLIFSGLINIHYINDFSQIYYCRIQLMDYFISIYRDRKCEQIFNELNPDNTQLLGNRVWRA